MALQRFITSAHLIAVHSELPEVPMLPEAMQAKRVFPPLLAVHLFVYRNIRVDKV